MKNLVKPQQNLTESIESNNLTRLSGKSFATRLSGKSFATQYGQRIVNVIFIVFIVKEYVTNVIVNFIKFLKVN